MAGPDATATPPPNTNDPTWLVMVYMQAGDTSQLDNLAIQDLVEMEAGVRDNPNVQVLVQIQRRWPSVPQRYLLKSGALPVVRPEPQATDENADLFNMGTCKALADFLDAGLKVGARNYCLVLWGHAFGLGFGRDHGDPLQLQELQAAIHTFSTKRGIRLDILATNSCTMGYIEAAYQLKQDVQYLAASQVFVPLTGLPYKEILSTIDSGLRAPELGQIIVDRYVDHFTNSPQGERVAMALMNLDAADNFGTMLNGMARTITQVIGQGPKINFQRLSEVQDVFFVNPAGDVRPVLDLHALARDVRDFADDLTTSMEGDNVTGHVETRSKDQNHALIELRHEANELVAATDHASISVQARSAAARNRKETAVTANRPRLIVHHREHPDLEELHGVGVFAPFVVDKERRKRLEIDDSKERDRERDRKGMSAYAGLKIFSDMGDGKAMWPKLVYELLSREEADEIVDGTGVVRPADRRQVNQLLVAIEGAFNRLDRVLRITERPLAAAVAGNRGNGARAREILATYGPPQLRLAGGLSLADPKRLTASPPKKAGHPQTRESIVPTLAKIERAVQLVEKTCKRVATNRTFGLGPPSSRTSTLLHLGEAKEAGEVLGEAKEAGEVLGEAKEAGEVLGEAKEAGEVLGPLGAKTGAVLAFLSSDAQVAGLAVTTLFTQVALALSQLERSTAAIEFAAAQFLFAPGYGAMLCPRDYEESVKLRFKDDFSRLKEASLQARRVIRRILSHPLYGLGPGPEGLGQEERDALATAAGLNHRNLRLL